MNWEEVRTRVSQEVSKRLDLTLYRTGLRLGAPRPRPQPAAHARFFFGKDDEPAHRAALLRTHLPHEAEGIIYEADDICRHAFHLLGYEKLDYGRNIDWHSAHGKRSSPSEPRFKINFLDFHAVGDHKVIWELNRHQHLVTLAKAWLLTAIKFIRMSLRISGIRGRRQIRIRSASTGPARSKWHSAACPGSGFEICSLAARTFLLPSKRICFSLCNRMDDISNATCRRISRPTLTSLGEAVALFFIGTLCPEISAADRWQNQGWNTALEESERQVRSDGVYFEQALYYHVYALDFLLHARILASENGFAIPERFDNILKKMLDVIQALFEVGPAEGFGDDDGGRVFNPRRNQVENMTDPLALGAILYDCHDYATASLTEEAIWLFGDQAIQVFEKPHPQLAAASKAFEAGGIYLINDHDPYAQQMMIDAGPQGTGHSGHGHADALSIRFSLDGRRFLIDPGTYCYISDGEERDWFRGTGAHNIPQSRQSRSRCS